MPLKIDNKTQVGERADNWIDLAEEVGRKSNCVRRSVGALLVKNGHIIARGWNGVSTDLSDCRRAGCPRCTRGGETGSGYETCICIHAEQRAVAEAAKAGVSTAGCTMYVTLRPCLQCLAICIAAGVRRLFYAGEEWGYPSDVEKIYHVLSDQFEMFGRVEDPQNSRIGSEFRVIGRI